jgi:hypothetical protein
MMRKLEMKPYRLNPQVEFEVSLVIPDKEQDTLNAIIGHGNSLKFASNSKE